MVRRLLCGRNVERWSPALTRPTAPPRLAGPCKAAPRAGASRWPGLASLPQPPADLRGKTFKELAIVGALRRLPDALVEPARIIADEDPPLLRPDAVENDLRRLCRRGRRLLEEAPRALSGERLDIFIRHRVGVDSHGFQALPRLPDVVLAEPV